MKLKRIFIPLAALGMAATLAGCGETDPQIISNKNKIAENQANIEAANASIAELKEKLEAADSELAKSITQQIADLKTELVAADKAAKDAFDALIAELEGTDSELENLITELQAADTAAATRLNALEALAETLATTAQVTELQNTVSQIETTLKGRLDAIEEVLMGEGAELSSRFEAIESRLTTAEGKLTSLNAVVETLATKEELKNQVDALSERLDVLESDPTTKTYLDGEIKKINDALGDEDDIAKYDDNLNFVEGTIFGRINYMEDRWAKFNSNEIINLKVQYIYNLSKVYADFDKTMSKLRAEAAEILAFNTSLKYKGRDTQTESDDIYDSDEIKALLDNVFTKISSQWTHDMKIYFDEGFAKLLLVEQAPYTLTDEDKYATDDAIKAYEDGTATSIEYLEAGTEITEIERIYGVYRDLLMSFNDEAKFVVYKEIIKTAVSKLEYLGSGHIAYTLEDALSDINSSDGVIDVIGTGNNTTTFDYIVSSILDINYELEITPQTTKAERDDYLDSLLDKLNKWLYVASELNENYEYEEESKKLLEAISSTNGTTSAKYLSQAAGGSLEQLFKSINDEVDPLEYLIIGTNDEYTRAKAEEEIEEIIEKDVDLMDLVVRRGYGYNSGMIYTNQMKAIINGFTNITANEKTKLGNRLDVSFANYVDLDADNAPIYEFNQGRTAVTVTQENDGERLTFDKAIIDLYLEQATEYNRICEYTNELLNGTIGINTDAYEYLNDSITRDEVTKTAKEWFVELIKTVPNIDNYLIDFELQADDAATTDVDETETYAEGTARANELKDTIADTQYENDEEELNLYRFEATCYDYLTKVANDYSKDILDKLDNLATQDIASSQIFSDLEDGFFAFIRNIDAVRGFDNYYKKFAYEDVQDGETPETHEEAIERMLQEIATQYGTAGATEIDQDKEDKSGDLEAMALLLYETKAYYTMMQYVFDTGVDIYDIYNHNKHTALKNETDLVYNLLIAEYKEEYDDGGVLKFNDLYLKALLECEAEEDDPDTTDTDESKTVREVIDELMNAKIGILDAYNARVQVYNELFNYVRLDYYGVKVTADTFTTDGTLYERNGEGTDLEPYYFTPITSGTYSETALYFAKSVFVNNVINELENLNADEVDAFVYKYDDPDTGYIAKFDDIAEHITSVEGWAETYTEGKKFIDLTVYNAQNYDKIRSYAKQMHVQNTDSTKDNYLKYLTDAEITEFNGYIDACIDINDFLDDAFLKDTDENEYYESDDTYEAEADAIDIVQFRAVMLNKAREYADSKLLVFESKGTEINEETFNAGTYFVDSGTGYALATEWVSGTEYFQVKGYTSLRVQDVKEINNRILSFIDKDEYVESQGTATSNVYEVVTGVYDADKVAIDLTLQLANEFNKAREYAKSQRDAIDALTMLTDQEKKTDKDKVDGILDAITIDGTTGDEILHISEYIEANDLATAQGKCADDKAAMQLRYYHSYTINRLRIKTDDADAELGTLGGIDNVYTAAELEELYGENTDQSPSRLATITNKIHAFDDFTVEKNSISEYDSYYANGEVEIGLYTHFAVVENNILALVTNRKNQIATKSISQTHIEDLGCTTEDEAKKELSDRLLAIYKANTLISYTDGVATFNVKSKAEANANYNTASAAILDQIDEYLS